MAIQYTPKEVQEWFDRALNLTKTAGEVGVNFKLVENTGSTN